MTGMVALQGHGGPELCHPLDEPRSLGFKGPWSSRNALHLPSKWHEDKEVGKVFSPLYPKKWVKSSLLRKFPETPHSTYTGRVLCPAECQVGVTKNGGRMGLGWATQSLCHGMLCTYLI